MTLKRLGASTTEVKLSNDTTVLVSYETPVAAFIPGKGYVKTAKKWSRTTSKHITKWLNGFAATEVPQSDLDSLL